MGNVLKHNAFTDARRIALASQPTATSSYLKKLPCFLFRQPPKFGYVLMFRGIRLKHEQLNTYWYIMRNNQGIFCEYFFEKQIRVYSVRHFLNDHILHITWTMQSDVRRYKKNDYIFVTKYSHKYNFFFKSHKLH